MGLYGASAPNFCVSFLLRLLFSLKCRNQNCENPYQKHQTKNEKVTKKCTYIRKIIRWWRLLRLGLYIVSTPRVDNDAPIVAHICYISLLRSNYYDKYLACEQEDVCERYITFKGNWELLSGERLVILLKIDVTG